MKNAKKPSERLASIGLVATMMFALGCGPDKKKGKDEFSGDEKTGEEQKPVESDPQTEEKEPEQTETTPPPPPPAPSAGCGKAPAAKKFAFDLTVGTEKRQAQVVLPETYDMSKGYPLLFSFHSLGGTATSQADLFQLDTKGAARGFITIHPEGLVSELEILGLEGQSWNSLPIDTGADDIGFFKAMMAKLTADLCVDTKNVFLTGYSNGGFLSQEVACELADQITAIASVAGTNILETCTPKRPVAMLHLHGTFDRVVFYNDNPLFRRGARSTAELWAKANTCTQGPAKLAATPFAKKALKASWQLEQWLSCKDNKSVLLGTILGGDHVDPWSYEEGIQEANATDLILEFFEGYLVK